MVTAKALRHEGHQATSSASARPSGRSSAARPSTASRRIPLGGFCKIVGMTPQDDDVDPADEPRAMWRFPVWKRTIVMSRRLDHPLHARHRRAVVRGGLRRPAQPGAARPPRRRPAAAGGDRPRRLRRGRRRPAAHCTPGDPAEPGRAGRPAGRRQDHRGRTAPPVATYGDADSTRSAGSRRAPAPRSTTCATAARQRPTVNLASVQRPPLDDPDGPVSHGRRARRRARASRRARHGHVQPGRARSARPPTTPADWRSAPCRR